jgi:protein-S-isoprenylcysteine O-methyltransferase Ste14
MTSGDRPTTIPNSTPSAASRARLALALDVIERCGVVALFAVFVWRMLSPLTTLIQADIAYPELLLRAADSNLGALLVVLSETLTVGLILARHRSSTVSSHPLDWALVLAASCAPYLAMPALAAGGLQSLIGTMLMLTGLTVQIWAKTALWRSFGVVPAIHRVKTGGPYGLIRHPMYTGYTLTHVGFIVGSPSLWNALLYTVTFAIQVARLLREEHFLTREPVYRDYAARVRYRLLPGLF